MFRSIPSHASDAAVQLRPWTDLPDSARIEDYLLDGGSNWKLDREHAARLERLLPAARHLARDQRRFLVRAVHAALDAGVRQFLDLGAGMPTIANVHELVEHYPGARTVYVDHDPIAVANTGLRLIEQRMSHLACAIEADIRQPASVLDLATTHGRLDLGKPICVLLVGVLHHLRHPAAHVAAYRDALAPGSCLAVSHITSDGVPPQQQAQLAQFAAAHAPMTHQIYPRHRADVVAFFDGWDLLHPGISRLPDWRPEPFPHGQPHDARLLAWCGAGVKPA